jgi:hypothetical protein
MAWTACTSSLVYLEECCRMNLLQSEHITVLWSAVSIGISIPNCEESYRSSVKESIIRLGCSSDSD